MPRCAMPEERDNTLAIPTAEARHPEAPEPGVRPADPDAGEDLEAAAKALSESASEIAGLADTVAAQAGAPDKLRLKHLLDLVHKGALDQDIYEAVVEGTVYLLEGEPPSPHVLQDFRLRYKCDLSVFHTVDELLDAARHTLPDAVVVAGQHAAVALPQLLPELLLAAFGTDPVPVVALSDRESLFLTFEVLTYPALAFISREQGAEGLLDALARHLAVTRTEAELKTHAAIKQQIGLDKAQAIQQNLLPEAVPDVRGLDIAAYYNPCQEVGGDYYDFFAQPDGSLGIVCADVSGKGVSAAMVMVMFRSILRLAADRGMPPHDVMRVTNLHVTRDMLRGMFVTALYLRIDPREHAAQLVNAGHMPLLHWPVGQEAPAEAPVRGLAVGLVTGERFADTTRQGTLGLHPGDLLCLYTDGIAEAENPRREQFGTHRLIDAIRHAGRGSAQGTVDAVVAAVDAFCDGAPPHDDTTLIVIRMTKP